jgi:hypothetical protein
LLVGLPLLLGACAAGGNWLTLRKTADSVQARGYSYDQIYEATRDSLDELGVITRASRDKGMITGQIPPFKVRARLERPSPGVRLVGVSVDKSCWRRDSLRRVWVLSCYGTKVTRKGAVTLDSAIAMWNQAVRKRIP